MIPTISLIVTVYNQERYLSAAIESILAQSRGDFELLIWDDGSTDRSPEIAREYEKCDRRVRVIVAEHLGRGLALKAAIAQTSAPYVGWVDSDDLLAPTALAETAAILDAKSEIGWVYTDYLDIDARNTVLSYGYRCLIPYSREELLNKFMTFHFRLIRREAFDLAGGIDESLEAAEDYDLCLRLSEVAKVQHIFRPLYYYRTHAGSISRQRQQEQIERSHQAARKAQQRRSRNKDLHLIPLTQLIRQKHIKENWVSSKFATLTASILPLVFGLFPNFAQAQSITPANDGTGTVITNQGNNIDISGGSLSGDRTNLFHSFSKFGLDANQTANFLSQPSIQNILGRVTGGDASLINGLITVTGGNSNLYLINPAGIIFGPNASLNVPASFTATTANRIGFGENWLNASGWNNYTTLLGTPNSFAFDSNIVGAIANQGNLTVPSGHNLTLIGGTVASTGEISTPGGKVVVAAVPGTSLVRFSIPGNPLSLEIQPINASANANNQATNSLATLLTGGGGGNASQLTVNSNGEVELTGSGLRVENGDVVATKVTADTATFIANHNLILPESQLFTTGNLNLLAKDTAIIRDSAANNFAAIAGGHLYIQGDRGIDILAINHLDKTPFISGGDLTIVSDGKISLDAHFTSGGKFSILNSQGNAGNFISLYDPIISSEQDVIFGDYEGPALKVETRGSINGGDITITEPDDVLAGICIEAGACSADEEILASEPALILRAGLNNLESIANVPPDTTSSGTNFSGDGVTSSPANINVGNINTSSPDFERAGRVILEALNGDITTGDINSSITNAGDTTIGGLVNIQAGGNVTTGNINTSAENSSFSGSSNTRSGDIDINAGGNIITNAINAFAVSRYGDAVAANVNLEADNDITFESINTRSRVSDIASSGASAGNVSVLANGVVKGIGEVLLDGETPSGNTILTSAEVASGSGPVTPGNVNIQHGGGSDNVPFIVGDASQNGTQAAINTGISEITPTSTVNTFPVLENGGIAADTPSNISITSINTPPTLTTNVTVPTTQENQPVTFRFGDLNVSINDEERDNLTVVFDELRSGTLTLENGTSVTQGTILSDDTVLTYTPATNTTGNIVAFTIQASDRVSSSSPQNIGINVNAIPPNPPDQPDPLDPPDQPDPLDPLDPPDSSDLPNPEVLKKNPSSQQQIVVNDSSSKIEIDNTIVKIDEKFTNQFQEYLGSTSEPDIKNLSKAQEILESVEKATGVKPALIYVSFVPETLPNSDAPDPNRILNIVSPNDRLEVIIVTAKGQPIRKVLKVTRSQFLETARIFRNEITNRRLSDDYKDSAQQMYRWLIAPMEIHFQNRGINNIVFIMDEGLRSLPVAALYDGQQYLVERYSIGLMPSLSLTDTKYVDVRKAEVLSMGASQFASTDQQPLPAVPVELSTITPRLWLGKSFLNESFTLENLQVQRQQKPYGIVHLATHGQFKPGKPNNSYIQLWDTQLRMNELRGLGWNKPPVELVVLSACRTAIGDREAELGFAGFAVQAGAKSALASLWYVSDEGTLGLISQFYEELKKAPIKAEALRQAQIGMIKGQVRLEGGKLITSSINVPLPPALAELGDKDLKHPYFWSAFTMIGNPW